jgi:hypothetical protein
LEKSETFAQIAYIIPNPFNGGPVTMSPSLRAGVRTAFTELDYKLPTEPSRPKAGGFKEQV